MLLRQVQARPLQGHRLRALRRRGHALQGPPRAHGTRRPRRAGQPHLVLQGRPEPHRLPDRHAAQGAREGPLLRRLDRHLGRRGGARQGHGLAGEGGPQGPRQLCGRARGARSGAARVTRAPREVPPKRQTDELQRRRPHVGGGARRQHLKAFRRGAREAPEGPAQSLRRRHRRHRGLHRGRGRAHAQRVGALQDDGAQADRARRDHLSRAQGALRPSSRSRCGPAKAKSSSVRSSA